MSMTNYLQSLRNKHQKINSFVRTSASKGGAEAEMKIKELKKQKLLLKEKIIQLELEEA